MPQRRPVISGPDIDRLAEGIHGPEIKALATRVKDLTGANEVLRGDVKKLRRQAKGALNHNATLLGQLAEVRETRERLAAENNRLRAQLLNAGITPLEQKEVQQP